jgi:transcriptional adapter 2-alpha
VGLHTLAEAQDYEEERKRREEYGSRKQRDTSYLYNQDRNSARNRLSQSKYGEKWQEKPLVQQQQQQSQQIKPKIRKSSPLDIAGATGFDLLSESEKELCSNIRLFPSQYLVIKETLIRESLRQGHLKKGIARQLLKIGTINCIHI